MSPAEVLATYRPAFGGPGWKRAIRGLLADPGSAQRVELLRVELVRHGGFAEPIVVEPARREILDGMHRIAAAVLSEHDTLEVADSYADLPDRRRVQVVLGAGTAVGSWAVDRVAGALRSFPFAGGWTTCAGLFPGEREIVGWWHCPAGRDEALGAELIGRAARAGVRLTLGPITAIDDSDDQG
ncbi:hypothetical protein FHX34_105221 [Actinoplanes teichomyceticus]|uniref:Uncharacterized protein n=2 Tax=Actinoplanes teichomyceticus TaxID=1867 RepID=A0A561VL86_ACTTI|nr:hypothetical protein FHX34_105221 [Actinoplanes teichomyceticus]